MLVLAFALLLHSVEIAVLVLLSWLLHFSSYVFSNFIPDFGFRSLRPVLSFFS